MILVRRLLVGPVRSFDGWRSAIQKEPVAHPLWLSSTGLAGDEVEDLRHHGGPEQAVLAYAESHYDLWKAEGYRHEPGAFGENLLLSGVADQSACIGDVYTVGDATVQISCPRSPCNTLARHHGRPDIVPKVYATGRGGWYFRVLQEGFVAQGQPMDLVERPHPDWTVARALRVRWEKGKNPGEASVLADLSSLNPAWRNLLLS